MTALERLGAIVIYKPSSARAGPLSNRADRLIDPLSNRAGRLIDPLSNRAGRLIDPLSDSARPRPVLNRADRFIIRLTG